ncbi:helix-turn-helix transcriptional regulator [Exiguobacterium oxidotolerans]|uniref:WYL domain-containing protein n=1 Tax=Exiguobacterium oxidotolerans TaxID=223958 RepID=A0A653IIZ5_9BACL|nr:WYL domain-containing protein [Exiguobacterium oxidotolerans]VWX38580.1 WYL domain-containing protein [Exiguobacterium oxidotolerans]
MPTEKLSNRDRLLAVRDIFEKYSDEEETLTLEDLSIALSKRGLIEKLSRKSLKDDIEALAKSGFDVVKEETKNGLATPYHLVSRRFEHHQLRLLVDAIASAKFISESETQALVRTIQSLTSERLAKTLNPVIHTVKKPKGVIPFSIDTIQKAITEQEIISFQYQGKFNERTRKFELRRDGDFYLVTPAHLIVDNGNYYLIGRDERVQQIRTYRVDRIVQCSVFEPAETPVEVDPSYLSNMFNMYGGEDEQLTLKFHESVMPTVVDRFGTDIRCRRIDEEWFEVKVSALFSEGFMIWLIQFAHQAEIIEPSERREAFKEKVLQLARIYQESSVVN